MDYLFNPLFWYNLSAYRSRQKSSPSARSSTLPMLRLFHLTLIIKHLMLPRTFDSSPPPLLFSCPRVFFDFRLLTFDLRLLFLSPTHDFRLISTGAFLQILPILTAKTGHFPIKTHTKPLNFRSKPVKNHQKVGQKKSPFAESRRLKLPIFTLYRPA